MRLRAKEKIRRIRGQSRSGCGGPIFERDRLGTRPALLSRAFLWRANCSRESIGYRRALLGFSG